MGEAVDCPPCIRNWTGSKVLFWSLDLDEPNSSKVYRDLAWMKAFLVNEQFSWVPDPLHSQALLGIDMQILNLTAESQDRLVASYKQHTSLVEGGRQSTCNSIENLEMVERQPTYQHTDRCEPDDSQGEPPMKLGTLQDYLALIRDQKVTKEQLDYPRDTEREAGYDINLYPSKRSNTSKGKWNYQWLPSSERVGQSDQHFDLEHEARATRLGSSRTRIPSSQGKKRVFEKQLKPNFSQNRSSKLPKSRKQSRKGRSFSHNPRRYSSDSTATKVTHNKDIRMQLRTSIDFSQLIRLKTVSPISYNRFLTPQKQTSKPWDSPQPHLSLTWQGLKYGLFDRHSSDPRAGSSATKKKRPKSQTKNLMHYAIPGFSPKMKFGLSGG